MAQEEKWDYKGTSDKQILYNYLCYTYDRIKAENKIEISDDKSVMCFNTGLLTEHGADIYTDKSTKEAKIQLLLPLFLQSRDVADLALVVDKGEFNLLLTPGRMATTKPLFGMREIYPFKVFISRMPTAEDYLEMISAPSWVISTMYSIWADSPSSMVYTVQSLSSSTKKSGLPSLIMG